MKSFIILMSLVSTLANAAVFKCVTTDGKTVFTNTSCPNDTASNEKVKWLDSNTLVKTVTYNTPVRQKDTPMDIGPMKKCGVKISGSMFVNC